MRFNFEVAQLSKVKSHSSYTRRDIISCDVAVIGAGPGGYACAIKASQLGLKTVLIDQNQRLGGTCLNKGCIPSKCLLTSSDAALSLRSGSLHSRLGTLGVVSPFDPPRDNCVDLQRMHQFKNKTINQLASGLDHLMRKYSVECLMGRKAKLVDHETIKLYDHNLPEPNGNDVIKSKFIVIATGSANPTTPWPTNGSSLVTSDEALEFDSIPNRIGVIGGGAIGLELGSVWARLGSQVTIFESRKRILEDVDEEMGSLIQMSMTKREGVKFELGVDIVDVESPPSSVTVVIKRGVRENGLPGDSCGTESLSFDKVIISIGRDPYTESLGLTDIGINVCPLKRIMTDDWLRTSVKNVFAIGDVVGRQMLAHKAEEEGVQVSRIIKSLVNNPRLPINKIPRIVEPSCDMGVPSVIYTNPEVAWIGHQKEYIRTIDGYNTFTFPLLANSRARITGTENGMMKIITTGESDVNRRRVVWAGIVHLNAGDLITIPAVAMKSNISLKEFAGVAFPHPSISEGIKEALMGCIDGPIHL